MRTGLLLLLSGWAWAQLSGIVNSYAAVMAFVDPATVTVDNPLSFQRRDRVLLYQAKSATISTNNDPTYGDITSIGSAGVFEFHQIAAISRPYQLSDLSGRTLTQGYLPPKTPLTLSLESLPAWPLLPLHRLRTPHQTLPLPITPSPPFRAPLSLPLWRVIPCSDWEP
jgi:hypothetical protein